MELLLNSVSHWGPPRWVGRADGVHALVQRLADLGADAEDRPHRPVPRLDSDLALPDQLRVMVADLLGAAAAPELLDAAADAIRAARRALHRPAVE